jgi:hypothetical protein
MLGIELNFLPISDIQHANLESLKWHLVQDGNVQVFPMAVAASVSMFMAMSVFMSMPTLNTYMDKYMYSTGLTKGTRT